MVEETRRERQRRQLIADVLTEARTQLEAGGPAAVSLRAIARAVGMSAPSLYTYFPSLADMFTELIMQSYSAMAEAVSSAVDQAANDSLDSRLRAGPHAYRSWALANRQQFNLLFFDQISGYAAPADGPTVDAQTAVLEPIARIYAEAIGTELGALTEPGDPLTGFLGWWGAFHGLVALEVNHHLDWVDSGQVFEQRLGIDIAHLLRST